MRVSLQQCSATLSRLPEDVQELRKSILLAFPETEFRNNPAISFDDQNDFYIDFLAEQNN